jgi:hypothetical protein
MIANLPHRIQMGLAAKLVYRRVPVEQTPGIQNKTVRVNTQNIANHSCPTRQSAHLAVFTSTQIQKASGGARINQHHFVGRPGCRL